MSSKKCKQCHDYQNEIAKMEERYRNEMAKLESEKTAYVNWAVKQDEDRDGSGHGHYGMLKDMLFSNDKLALSIYLELACRYLTSEFKIYG